MIVPSIEEFGITAVEAQAAGRPVIAAGAGGALETVLDRETGWLALPDSVESFVEAIDGIDELDFSAERAVQNAERFSVAVFQERLSAHVGTVVERGAQRARGAWVTPAGAPGEPGRSLRIAWLGAGPGSRETGGVPGVATDLLARAGEARPPDRLPVPRQRSRAAASAWRSRRT